MNSSKSVEAPQGIAAGLTTAQFAALIAVQVQTIYKRHCQTGSYFGVIPQVLRNRRLLWPLDAVQQLRRG